MIIGACIEYAVVASPKGNVTAYHAHRLYQCDT
jgi:hypothetical protein